MKFLETSNLYSLNKSTYINLRWISYVGQLTAILVVEFFLKFEFNYLVCISIVFLSILTNLYLIFKIKYHQLNNFIATSYLSYDIGQLGFLLYLTGGITNPFIFLIIIPSVFSAQYLNIWSSVILVIFTSLILAILTFFYFQLPHPETMHFHAPQYYLYSIPISIFIGLIFLVYFGVKFGIESRIIEINDLIARANVIDVTKLEKKDNVIFGSTVCLVNLENNEKNIYKIVGKDEADITKNYIYFRSPIGKALIGKKKKELVIVKTPSGEKNFEITEVKYI